MAFSVRKQSVVVSFVAVLLFVYQNCSGSKMSFAEISSFDSLSVYEVGNSGRYQTFFKYDDLERITLKQEDLGLNQNSLKFRVDSEAEVSLSDIKIYENGTPVTRYKVDENTLDKSKFGNVDIALIVDKTGSMGSTIESIKIRLKNFVENVYAKGSNTRICISTFEDTTISKCSKFYIINSADPASLEQKNALLAQLAGLSASGGGDLPENPLRAILDSLSADWIPTNQQFIILVTDVNFHHSPSYQGDAKDSAPAYEDVLAALAKRKINIFAATPSVKGYDMNFNTTLPGIVSATDGEWFLYSDIVLGKLTFDSILDRIVKRVNSYYKITYISEENSLNPQLAVANRALRVEVTSDATAKVNDIQLVSNLPNGRPEYKKEFSLTNNSFNKSTVVVSVNGKRISSGYSISTQNKLIFSTPPAPAAQIQVDLKLTNLKQSIKFSSIVFASNLKADSIYLVLNGKVLDRRYYKLEKSLEGRFTMLFDESLFTELDTLSIRQNGGLNVDIRYLYQESPQPNPKDGK